MFDLAGRRVAELVDAEQLPGEHEAVFDAGGFATGAYTYRLTTAAGIAFRALVLVK